MIEVMLDGESRYRVKFQRRYGKTHFMWYLDGEVFLDRESKKRFKWYLSLHRRHDEGFANVSIEKSERNPRDPLREIGGVIGRLVDDVTYDGKTTERTKEKVSKAIRLTTSKALRSLGAPKREVARS